MYREQTFHGSLRLSVSSTNSLLLCLMTYEIIHRRPQFASTSPARLPIYLRLCVRMCALVRVKPTNQEWFREHTSCISGCGHQCDPREFTLVGPSAGQCIHRSGARDISMNSFTPSVQQSNIGVKEIWFYGRFRYTVGIPMSIQASPLLLLLLLLLLLHALFLGCVVGFVHFCRHVSVGSQSVVLQQLAYFSERNYLFCNGPQLLLVVAIVIPRDKISSASYLDAG